MSRDKEDQKPERRRYSVQGIDFSLEHSPEVFEPSPRSLLLAEILRVTPGERVIDIGTGSGVQAIVAAKLGGEVVATDKDQTSVDLAVRNAVANGVSIQGRCGEYFTGLSERFDVIIANLPQMVLSPRVRAEAPEMIIRALDGGENGTQLVSTLLHQALAHMHSESRLYLMLDTISDITRSLELIRDSFDAHIVNVATTPLPLLVMNDIAWYQARQAEGKISMICEDGQWKSHQQFLELRMRSKFVPHSVYHRPVWIEDCSKDTRVRHVRPESFDPAARYSAPGRLISLASNPHQPLEDPFDLRNLRVLPIEGVTAFAAELEQAARALDGKRELVAIIGTGGTIAMKRGADGILDHHLDPHFLLSWAGSELHERFAAVAYETPMPIDSSQQEIDFLADLVILMSTVWKTGSKQLRERCAGFLVVHGTDTMAPSAATVEMMLGPNCPFSVGFVGSQKTIEDSFSDVAPNICYALESLALIHRAQQHACFVYMGGSAGGAYPAVGVQKISDRLVDSFDSPVHPKIIDVRDFGSEGLALDFQRQLGRAVDRVDEFLPIIYRGYWPIIQVQADLGKDPALYYWNIINATETRAVVFITTGSFTANLKLQRAVMHAASRTGKPVFAINPFPEGSTHHVYRPAEVLRRSGAYPVSIMLHALVAKIGVAFRVFGADQARAIDFVCNNNYVGEQQPAYWRSKRRKHAQHVVELGVPRQFVERVGVPQK